jgi:RNA polymerase sigma factor (sigma-70 family)
MPEDDATLLRRFAETRAQDAFAELVGRNMDAVYSAALRQVSGDVHLAEDVAQQVFVMVARRAHELARHPVLAGWLHTTTRNTAINLVRTESRRRVREQEAHAMNELIADDNRDVVWRQLAVVLDDVIHRLNEKDRIALLLRFFEQRSFAEMGAALRLTEDAARMRVDRAIQKLRFSLERRGIKSTAAALSLALAQHTVGAAPAGLASATSISAVSAAAARTSFLSAALVERFATVAAPALLVIMIAFVGVGYRESRELASVLLAEQQRVAATERRFDVLAQHTPPTDLPSEQQERRSDSLASSKESGTEMRGGGRRLEIAATYEPLYRSLQLTPVQIEHFEATRARSPDSIAWTFELDPLDRAALPTAASLLPDEAVDAELRDQLGERGYESYKDFNRSLPARTLARQLASAVYQTDPLLPMQVEQLTWIMGEVSPSYLAGGAIDRASLDWDAVLTRASGVLSHSQLAAFGGAVRQKEMFHQALLRRLSTDQQTTILKR